MRKLGLGLLSFVVIATLAGCGGSGNSSTSLFAGTFSGPWSQANDIPSSPPVADGTIDVTVSSGGHLTGTYTENTPTARTGPLTGTVQSNGDIAFDVAFPAGTSHFTGTVALTNDHLTGTFGEVGTGTSGFAPTMDLTRQ